MRILYTTTDLIRAQTAVYKNSENTIPMTLSEESKKEPYNIQNSQRDGNIKT